MSTPMMRTPLAWTVHTVFLILLLIPYDAAAATIDHSIFDTMLQANVRDERVDYLNIRKNYWPQLIAYLDTLAKVDPTTLSRDQQLALYINLYNASMIRAMIERFRVDYTPSDSLYRVFKEKFVRINHQTITLDHLEHKIIRPTFKDPRVHAALVCAAHSCPPLLDRAYVAEHLDATLDKKMRDFINDATRNRIETDQRTLRLSKIFDWYADDFGGKSKLVDYISTYLQSDVTGFRVKFLSYSWKLNVAHPQLRRWISIATRSAKILASPVNGAEIVRVKKNEVFEVLREEGGWLLLDIPFSTNDGWIKAALTKNY